MNTTPIGHAGCIKYPTQCQREIDLFRARRVKALQQAASSVSLSMASDPNQDLVFRQQAEKEKLPAMWISVPEEHAGKDIVANPLYDIDEGRVIITRYELFQWVWTRMEIGMRQLTAGLSSDSHGTNKRQERSGRLAMAADRDRRIHSHLVPHSVPYELDEEGEGYGSPLQMDDLYAEGCQPPALLPAKEEETANDDGGLVPMELDTVEVEALPKDTIATQLLAIQGDDDDEEETRPLPELTPEQQQKRDEENAKRAKWARAKPVEVIPAEMRQVVMSVEEAHNLTRADMALRLLHHYAKAEDDRDNAVIEAHRLARLGSGSLEGLTIERVKRSFPPCMGRVVMDALVHRSHPKHKTRVSLVKFLLEAGFSVPDVDKLVYDMYEADRDYVYTEHAGRWDKEAYNTVFKGDDCFVRF